MQSVQRQFGKLKSKGPGENAKVAVLLNDYEDADKVLAQVGQKLHHDAVASVATRLTLPPSSSLTMRGCGGTRGLPSSTLNCRL
jgi:hypothetical protein